jgi:hypothetical protein
MDVHARGRRARADRARVHGAGNVHEHDHDDAELGAVGIRPRHVVLAAGVALALGAPSAQAADTLPFSLATDSGKSSYFVFRSAARGQARGTVRVTSTAHTPRTILLRPVDVTTAATGGLAYGERPPRGVGRWIELSRRRVVVPAGGSVDVPFRVHVPARPGTGQRFAGIVGIDRAQLAAASSAPRPRRGRPLALRFLPRFAVAVEVRLPGAPVRRLEVRGLDVKVTPSGAYLQIRLANTGNQLITASSGNVTLTQAGQDLMTDAVDVSQFVPGTEIAYLVRFPGRPARDTYDVSGSLRPERAPPVGLDGQVTFGDGNARQFKRQTGREARGGEGMPLWAIAALVFAIAMAVTFAVAYLRARRGPGGGATRASAPRG